MTLGEWVNSVKGKKIGDGQCVSLVVNNPQSYCEACLYPGVQWENIIKPVPSAKDLLGAANKQYLTVITNDHSDPHQLPQQGDIMVFDATPHTGYTDSYNNPDGHTGVCYGASVNGYTLVQQNAPAFGQAVNVTQYPWSFRPCLGWLRPVHAAPAPVYYTVVQGDTMTSIAETHGLTLDALEKLNPQITNPDEITPGEHVRVK